MISREGTSGGVSMRRRSERGNMLALVAITALLLVSLLLFGLSFLSVSRGNLEQRSAAEAAALVAAQDIGKIVVNTPECGYVGLCSLPPTGTATKAQDNYFCEVQSINELMATARLNLIIANELGDDFLKQLALQDRQNAIEAKKALVTAIENALKPGGSATDAEGKEVKPYDDAEAYYLKNNAKKSDYVPGSLKLSLGNLEGGIGTQTGIPNPKSKASVNPDQVIGGCYRSETDVPYLGQGFVFASTGKQVSLADASKFRTSIIGLPFQVPSVVKVEADQTFHDQDKVFTQHFNACATTGNDVLRPACGALTISFPDGPVPEITSPESLYKWKGMTDAKCDVLTSEDGDFPVDPAAKIGATPLWPTPPWPSPPPPASDVSKLGLHDWLRGGGSRVNIDSALKMQTGLFQAPAKPEVLWQAQDPFTKGIVKLGLIPQGVMHIYTFNPDGGILYRSKAIKPYPYTVLSHNQMYSELSDGEKIDSGVAKWKLENIKIHLPKDPGKGKPVVFEDKTVDIEGTQTFDFYFRDMVRQPGVNLGGKHYGESLENPAVAYRKPDNWRGAVKQRVALTFKSAEHEVGGGGGKGPGAPPVVSRQDDFATSTDPSPPFVSYSTGPADGAPRPTYVQNGVAVDIRFRRQIKVGLLSILLGGFDVGYVGEML